MNLRNENTELFCFFDFFGLLIHKELILSSKSESESSFVSFWYLLKVGLTKTVSDTELGLLLRTEFTQNVELSLGFVHILSLLRGLNDLPFFILLFTGLTVSLEDSEKLCKPNLLSDTSSSVSISVSSSSIIELAVLLVRFFILFGVVFIIAAGLTFLFVILLYAIKTARTLDN